MQGGAQGEINTLQKLSIPRDRSNPSSYGRKTDLGSSTRASPQGPLVKSRYGGRIHSVTEPRDDFACGLFVLTTSVANAEDATHVVKASS